MTPVCAGKPLLIPASVLGVTQGSRVLFYRGYVVREYDVTLLGIGASAI